jgi:hypothetical protein
MPIAISADVLGLTDIDALMAVFVLEALEN